MLLAGVALGTEATRTGPVEGSAAWTQAQQLLERPGPALAEAVAAKGRGDWPRADWLLGEISARYPIVSDHADLMRAEVLLEESRGAETAQLAASALDAHPDSPLRADLLAIRGHALARLQDERGARKAWRAAREVTRDEELSAALTYAVAASEERTGDRRAAIKSYRALWRLHPLSPEADLAAARLDAFDAAGGEPVRRPTDWRFRGENLYRSRRNPEALAAFEHALTLGLSKAQAAAVRLRRAQTLFRMRQYPRAVEAFGELPQNDDIPIWHARSMARADRVPEAIAEFERIASKRGSVNALRARFLAALLLDGRGKTERARQYFQSLVRGSGGGLRHASLWRLAWGAYTEERYAEAIGFIDTLIAEERDVLGRLRLRYWRARALEGLGRGGSGDATATATARAEFEAMALEYPLTYYGWRARQRLPGVGAGSLPPPRPTTLQPGERKLAPRDLERVRILLEAGLDDHAVDELGRFSRRVGGVADRLELAQLFRSAGQFRSAQRIVIDPYQLALTGPPSPTFEDLWWHAWPAAYLDLVEAETSRPGSVDPALVYSIMREESGFRPSVVSPVGARGLLQIMEPTGERLARAVGHEDFDADDLFEPRTNIRLGSHYLAELSERFDGRLSAAIASYNAGPEAVSGWLEERGALEDDEWVESIPYDQTRDYVKRVMRSLQAYRLLY